MAKLPELKDTYEIEFNESEYFCDGFFHVRDFIDDHKIDLLTKEDLQVLINLM